MKRTYRVVVAKPGLDGYDRGAKIIARTLRDTGFEVASTGLHQTPEPEGVGARVFTSGASLDEIGTWLEAILDEREAIS